MDIRGSFSKLKKKFKHSGSKHLAGRKGDESDGEKIDPAGLPSSYVVAGGRNRGGDKASADGQRVSSMDRRPPYLSEPVPAPGRGSDQGEVGGGVDGGGVSQGYLHSGADVTAAVGSGPGREGNGADEEKAERINPSPSTASIPRNGKPEGVWTQFF